MGGAAPQLAVALGRQPRPGRVRFHAAGDVDGAEALELLDLERAARPTLDLLDAYEVSEPVGYAEAPQFRRAFKTWSGALAPVEYRTRVRYVASRVGPAPARFINWRYLEHVRGPAPKEALELVRYAESVYSFGSPIHVDDRSSPPAPPEDRDRQLDKAIELVMERIEAEPRRLPERPPGPIKAQ